MALQWEDWRLRIAQSRVRFKRRLRTMIFWHHMQAYQYLNISSLQDYMLRSLLIPQARGVVLPTEMQSHPLVQNFPVDIFWLDRDASPHCHAVRALRRALQSGGVLSFFDPTEQDREFVDCALGLEWDTAVWGSLPDWFQNQLRLNGKVVFHNIVRQRGLSEYVAPCAIGSPSNGPSILKKLRHEWDLSFSDHIVVKHPSGAGGDGIHDTRDMAQLHAFFKRYAHDPDLQFIFERGISGPDDGVPVSLSVQFMLNPDTVDPSQSEVDILGATMQSMAGRYSAVGNLMVQRDELPGVSRDTLIRMYEFTYALAGTLALPSSRPENVQIPARRGYGCVDFVVRPDGVPFATEFGLRWTNGGYANALSLYAEESAQEGYASGLRVLYGQYVPRNLSDLCGILEKHGVLFDGRLGVIPVLVGQGKVIVAAIAYSSEEFESYMEQVQDRLS